MATEKATDTTATQNLDSTSPKLAKARTTRSKTSTAALQPDTTAPTATATATQAAPKKPRARATAKSNSAAAQAASAQVLSESVDVERSLLEVESSKSLHANAIPAKPVCKAHCGQCGREMRFVPFSLSNLMCRSCYGLDRYRRPTSPSLSSLTSSRPSGPR